jgi:imidazolonepropionase-like amidohydrolase
VTTYHVIANNIELWVRDGRIVSDPQRGADVLFGAYATAGLVDAHAHSTLDLSDRGLQAGANETVGENVVDYFMAGVTYLRDAGGVSMAAVELQGPRLAAAGRFLAPPGRYIADWTLPVDAAGLPAAVMAQTSAGARWVKVIGDWFSPDTGRVELHYEEDAVSAAVKAAHAAGVRVAMHCMDEPSIDVALAAGVDSIEHACNVTRSQVGRMAAQGTAWCPTITKLKEFMNGPTPDPAYQTRVRAFYAEALYELLPVAAELGITILAGSDTLPPADFWREIDTLGRYGLTPDKALAAGTSEARQYLGAPDLREGSVADVVLYEADPREDPDILASPSLVMVDGMIVSRGRRLS